MVPAVSTNVLAANIGLFLVKKKISLKGNSRNAVIISSAANRRTVAIVGND